MYAKMFANRSALSFFVVMLLLLTCVLRVFVITTGNYAIVQAEQTAYKINVSRLRGTIYDCNMIPLTNTSSKIVAAISPTPNAVLALTTELGADNVQQELEQLKIKKPVVCNVKTPINSSGVATATVYDYHSDKLSACHLIGYTDSTGHGVCGLESAYDNLLYSDSYVTAVFTTDAKGNVLEGVEPYFINDLSIIHSGVVTTLDINIQNIVEQFAQYMNSGCVVVSEVSSGKIRAMASVPTFDINDISSSLNVSNSPMLNKALCCYNIGSVFKPCVAASAVESGEGNCIFNCTGSMIVADRVFKCHKLSGHGNMDLQAALAQSCNCFFYNLSIKLGGEKIYKLISSLSIDSKIRIAENLYTNLGTIPQRNTLNNEGNIVNSSIGQGVLMSSPVAMLNLYNAIAGDGCYYLPSVVEKTIKNGVENQIDSNAKTRVMKADTATVLREYLKSVLTEGTGVDAMPNFTTAAGKTATAQTGRYYDDGTEITNSWFCGFFPADSPKYVVIVMSDDKLNVSTASIFSKIADEITVLERKNIEKTA